MLGGVRSCFHQGRSRSLTTPVCAWQSTLLALEGTVLKQTEQTEKPCSRRNIQSIEQFWKRSVLRERVTWQCRGKSDRNRILRTRPLCQESGFRNLPQKRGLLRAPCPHEINPLSSESQGPCYYFPRKRTSSI